MKEIYSNKTEIVWNWGKGEAKGKIIKASTKRMQKTIKGSKIVKNGSIENPAYLIEQEDGAQVLKLHSEIKTI